MRRFVLSFIAVSLIAFVIAGCGSGHKSSPVNTELEGVWTKYAPGTETVPEITITFVFHENDWELTWIETETSTIVSRMLGTFSLDTESDPKELNLYIVESSDESQDEGTTIYGIYELSGDNLIIASGDGGIRPTSFTAYNTIDLVKE